MIKNYERSWEVLGRSWGREDGVGRREGWNEIDF